MLTTFNEVDMLPIKDLRSKYGAEFEKEHEVKLGFMGFFVIAAVQALKNFQLLMLLSMVMTLFIMASRILVSLYQLIEGLVVPIIKDADTKSLPEIEKSILSYSEKAEMENYQSKKCKVELLQFLMEVFWVFVSSRS